MNEGKQQMNDLFDDPATIEAPRKRSKKGKAAPAADTEKYNPDKDRELTRQEIELVWSEHSQGYTIPQIAIGNRLPLKRTEYALGLDRVWYARMLQRLDLIAKYGQETFDNLGVVMASMDRDNLTDTEIENVPVADAKQIWALQWLPHRPSDLANVNWDVDPERERQMQEKEKRRKEFTYWRNKLNCSSDIAEIVRRTANGEPIPELGSTDNQDEGDIFDSLFGEPEEQEIGSDFDDYLSQEIIDSANKRFAEWLGTKSIAFADATRRNIWKYYGFMAARPTIQRRRKPEPVCLDLDDDELDD